MIGQAQANTSICQICNEGFQQGENVLVCSNAQCVQNGGVAQHFRCALPESTLENLWSSSTNGGRMYYFNIKTRETSWTLPDDARLLPFNWKCDTCKEKLSHSLDSAIPTDSAWTIPASEAVSAALTEKPSSWGRRWTDEEIQLLKEGGRLYGNNTELIAQHIGTRSKAQVASKRNKLQKQTQVRSGQQRIETSEHLTKYNDEEAESNMRTKYIAIALACLALTEHTSIKSLFVAHPEALLAHMTRCEWMPSNGVQDSCAGDPIVRSMRLRLAAHNGAVRNNLEEIRLLPGTNRDTRSDSRAVLILQPALAATHELLKALLLPTLTDKELFLRIGWHPCLESIAELLSVGFKWNLAEAQECAIFSVHTSFALSGLGPSHELNENDNVIQADAVHFLKLLAMSPPIALAVLVTATHALQYHLDAMFECIRMRTGVQLPSSTREWNGMFDPVAAPLAVCFHAPERIQKAVELCFLIEDLLSSPYPNIGSSGTTVQPLKALVPGHEFAAWATLFDKCFAVGAQLFDLPTVVSTSILRVAAFIV